LTLREFCRLFAHDKEQAGRLSNLLFFWIFRMTLRGKILAVVIAVFVVLTGVLFFI
jgi:hypothetical protein